MHLICFKVKIYDKITLFSEKIDIVISFIILV